MIDLNKASRYAACGLLLTILGGLPPTVRADGDGPRAFGVKAQGYPAGVIVAARASFPVRRLHILTAYAGYNRTDRRDFGRHDDEHGGGPGFGVAWQRYLGARYDGLHVGVRTDLWFLGIDWEDDGRRAGRTDLVVLQPTAEVGYTRTVAGGRLALEATLHLGAEINVETRGETVGEGAILLVGLGAAYRL